MPAQVRVSQLDMYSSCSAVSVSIRDSQRFQLGARDFLIDFRWKHVHTSSSSLWCSQARTDSACGRKSTVLALCSAVVASLLFWLLSSGFQQLGEHALLPPAVAVWAPIAIFAGGAFYFISRVRT